VVRRRRREMVDAKWLHIGPLSIDPRIHGVPTRAGVCACPQQGNRREDLRGSVRLGRQLEIPGLLHLRAQGYRHCQRGTLQERERKGGSCARASRKEGWLEQETGRGNTHEESVPAVWMGGTSRRNLAPRSSVLGRPASVKILDKRKRGLRSWETGEMRETIAD